MSEKFSSGTKNSKQKKLIIVYMHPLYVAHNFFLCIYVIPFYCSFQEVTLMDMVQLRMKRKPSTIKPNLCKLSAAFFNLPIHAGNMSAVNQSNNPPINQSINHSINLIYMWYNTLTTFDSFPLVTVSTENNVKKTKKVNMLISIVEI